MQIERLEIIAKTDQDNIMYAFFGSQFAVPCPFKFYLTFSYRCGCCELKLKLHFSFCVAIASTSTIHSTKVASPAREQTGSKRSRRDHPTTEPPKKRATLAVRILETQFCFLCILVEQGFL